MLNYTQKRLEIRKGQADWIPDQSILSVYRDKSSDWLIEDWDGAQAVLMTNFNHNKIIEYKKSPRRGTARRRMKSVAWIADTEIRKRLKNWPLRRRENLQSFVCQPTTANLTRVQTILFQTKTNTTESFTEPLTLLTEHTSHHTN